MMKNHIFYAKPLGMKYDFYDRLTREFPSQITVDATEVCNLACTHCPHPQFKKSEHYSGAMLTPELNEKLANEVKKFSHLTQYIRYTSNGEPLAHPKIYEMMSYAKKHSGVSVTLTTNGKIMNPNSVQKILESQIDLVDISLDAFLPETYAKIRVGGNLENTKKNVLNLIREKQAAKSHLKVIVSYIEQPENSSETADFESFWKDQGADFVVVRKLHSAAGSKQNVADEMWNILNTEKRRACLYPWERVILKANGTIGFCPTDWEDGSSVAHYSTTTIEALWQGEFFNKLRQAHVSGDYSCHSFCGKCPDWSLTSWPGEGRSYADMVEEFDKATTQVP